MMFGNFYGENNGDVLVRGIMYCSGGVKDSSKQGLLVSPGY